MDRKLIMIGAIAGLISSFIVVYLFLKGVVK
jgi:hypothetical protein